MVRIAQLIPVYSLERENEFKIAEGSTSGPWEGHVFLCFSGHFYLLLGNIHGPLLLPTS